MGTDLRASRISISAGCFYLYEFIHVMCFPHRWQKEQLGEMRCCDPVRPTFSQRRLWGRDANLLRLHNDTHTMAKMRLTLICLFYFTFSGSNQLLELIYLSRLSC
jgi:hypothetical protein